MIGCGERQRDMLLGKMKKVLRGTLSPASSRSMMSMLTHFRYWAHKNALSMDGLPGMRRGEEIAKRENVMPIKKMVGPLAPKKYVSPYGGVQPEFVVLAVVISFLLGCLFAFYMPLLRDKASRSGTGSQSFSSERNFYGIST
jgi:hypothetical protein